MIRWQANFQIPQSGRQTQWVYARVEDDGLVKLYADKQCTDLVLEKDVPIPSGVDPYDYLLSTDYFAAYERC